MGANKGIDPRVLKSRAKIFDTTTSIIQADGLDKISIERIAKESGVAKTTIYRQWDSLDDVIRSSLESRVQNYQLLETDKIELSVFEYLSYVSNNLQKDRSLSCLIDVLAKSSHDKKFKPLKNILLARLCGPLEEALTQGVDNSVLDKKTDIKLVTNMCVGTVVFNSIAYENSMSPGELKALVVHVIKPLKKSAS